MLHIISVHLHSHSRKQCALSFIPLSHLQVQNSFIARRGQLSHFTSLSLSIHQSQSSSHSQGVVQDTEVRENWSFCVMKACGHSMKLDDQLRAPVAFPQVSPVFDRNWVKEAGSNWCQGRKLIHNTELNHCPTSGLSL